MKWLVEAGADVHAVNEARFTALHGAAFRGLNEVIQYLVDQGADINARDFLGRTAYRIAEGGPQAFQFQAWPETAAFLRTLGADTALGVGEARQARDVHDPAVTQRVQLVHHRGHRAGVVRPHRGQAGVAFVGGAADREPDRLRPDPRRVEQPPALRLVGGEPAVRHQVAGQEVADPVGRGAPPVPDDLDLLDLPVGSRLPRFEERVDHRVELLLRRVPGLEQVVVDIDDVDRLDGRVGVRVRGQQAPARLREQVHRLLQELDAVHLRHPVVGQHDREPAAAQLQLAQRVQRLGS